MRRLSRWVGVCALAALAGEARPEPLVLVNRPQVNIRADATVQSVRLAVLRQGQEVEWLRRKDEWYQVRLPDGRNGWVNANLVQELWVVAGEGVRVRRGPTTADVSMTMVPEGRVFGQLSRRGDWLEVGLDDGRSGFVHVELMRPKGVSEGMAAADLAQRVAAEPEPAEPPEEVPPLPQEVAEPVQRSPYAEGLRHKADGDLEKALERFLAVLAEEPDNTKALFHAAECHKVLGEYEQALDKAYRAVALSGERPDPRHFLVLGDVYRLTARPDSARKYQALFRGETWRPSAAIPVAAPVPAAAVEEEEQAPPEQPAVADDAGEGWGLEWLLLLAAAGTAMLGGAAWILWRRSAGGEAQPKGAFAQEMEASAAAGFAGAGTGEEEELDRQIDEKWAALRQGGGAEGEEAALDGLLQRMESLRDELGQQDEREKIYADIVRLQNMKIEALKDEIRLIRRGAARG